jgi:hypothetical protein
MKKFKFTFDALETLTTHQHLIIPAESEEQAIKLFYIFCKRSASDFSCDGFADFSQLETDLDKLSESEKEMYLSMEIGEKEIASWSKAKLHKITNHDFLGETYK